MSTTLEDQQAPAIERRVRRLEDAHASMEKSINGLSTQLALAQQTQGHTRELLDSRFTAVEALISGVAGKLDVLTTIVQTQSTDPSSSVINREVERRLNGLEATIESHGDLIQRGIGLGAAFRFVVISLGVVGSASGLVSALHIAGVLR